MSPALVYTISRFGLLLCLWLFILAVVRAVRADVFGATIRDKSSSRKKANAKKPSHGAGWHAAGAAGAAVSAPTPPVSRAEGTTTNRSRRLTITSGPLAGSSVPLTQAGITIGRSQACSLVLDDHYVSSFHAKVYPKDGGWVLEDMESTNGTFLDGQRVLGAVELQPETVIRIGQSDIEVR